MAYRELLKCPWGEDEHAEIPGVVPSEPGVDSKAGGNLRALAYFVAQGDEGDVPEGILAYCKKGMIPLFSAVPDMVQAIDYTLCNIEAALAEKLITAPRWFQVQLGESAKLMRKALEKATVIPTKVEAKDFTQASQYISFADLQQAVYEEMYRIDGHPLMGMLVGVRVLSHFFMIPGGAGRTTIGDMEHAPLVERLTKVVAELDRMLTSGWKRRVPVEEQLREYAAGKRELTREDALEMANKLGIPDEFRS